ncbi:GPP34 family phosphoprotein [Aeromicrobium sp.]|uniref:GOLPH3/VPS74 family protein n=1 Tax=Aeromicrobium sp. TaxID=1871063 RepID=UPI0019CC9DD0|nr:GPP34 family phosphoprotein [Aeromicrobium sp.]MBC7632840.1 GPP34 family phosphoprotein [Aeromicrobium sp.]
MSTAEDFLLLVTDPDSGRARVGSMKSDAVFGGAILFDLVAAGRLALDAAGRKPRVVVVDYARVDDPVVQAAFERVRNRGRQTPQSTVTQLGKKARQHLYAALTAKGSVRPRHEKALGLFPLTRHDILDTGRRDNLLARVRAVLLLDQPADAETGPLVGLLAAADLTTLFVDKADRKKAKARAKIVAEGDWASEGVRDAIQAAQGAMTAAIVGASIVGTAGG